MSRSATLLQSPVGRTVLAAAGPFAVSGSQFVLAWVLLRVLPAAGFGAYSFLLVAAQLSWGVSSALIGAPLPLAWHLAEPARSRTLGAMYAVNALGTAACFALFIGLAAWLLPSSGLVLAFAAYAAVAMVRWFARAAAYAAGEPLRATASDFVQGSVTVAGAVLLLRLPPAALAAQALTVATAALLAGAILGLAPFGRDLWQRQVTQLDWRDLPAWGPSWRDHARWSLLGVVTTESTTNAHTYIVTAWRGPAAYAPIAASTLLVRPMIVVMNALGEFERARMARAYGAGRRRDLIHAVNGFRVTLALAWLITVGATLAVFLTAPTRLFPHAEMLHDIAVGATLNLVLAAIRAGRVPDSTLLQATGAFRALALASVISAGFSILLVAILVVVAGPIWSLGGIIAGEVVYAAATFHARWRLPHAAGGSAPAQDLVPE